MISSDAQRQVEANMARISENIQVIRSARWRLLRNRRLLDENWRLLRKNQAVLS